jgi:hypothetical protein
MPLDLATLRAWIDADPALSSLPISTASAMQIADVFNARTIDASRDVPAYEARRVVLLAGELAQIKLLAETRPATQATVVAMTFADTLADRETIIPASARSQIAGMLDVLVAAGVLTGATKAALMLLFAAKISRAQQEFGRDVTAGDVEAARNL